MLSLLQNETTLELHRVAVDCTVRRRRLASTLIQQVEKVSSLEGFWWFGKVIGGVLSVLPRFLCILSMFLWFKSNNPLELLVCWLCGPQLPSLILSNCQLCDQRMPQWCDDGNVGALFGNLGEFSKWQMMNVSHPDSSETKLCVTCPALTVKTYDLHHLNILSCYIF